MKNLRLQIALLLYVILVSVLLYYKPKLFFKGEDGSLKEFGVGHDKTIVPLWLVVLLLAFLSYYMSCLFMAMINK